MSKLQSLSVVATFGLLLAGSPVSSEARSISARSGSSAYFSEAGCWAPHGPSMTNTCGSPVYWHIPLVLDGSTFGWYHTTVTAQAGSAASDVFCQIQAWTDKGVYAGGYNPGTGLPFFGPAASVNLGVWVPSGGTAMLDCYTLPGGRVHTVNW